MQVGPAPLQSSVSRERQRLAALGSARTPRVSLAVASIGHLVAHTDLACSVQSVFTRACNFAWRDTLLTLLAAGGDPGPTVLVLAHDAAARDLRTLFTIGDVMSCRSDGIARTRRTELRLGDAALWRPAAPRACASRARIDKRRRRAAARLARWRCDRSSVIDRQGGSVVAGLVCACRALDAELAVPAIDRLVGWGEGLTPAGDDFLVGWLAALARLASDDDDRRCFVARVGATIVAAAPRTTPIAAHALRLAVQGHVVASLDGLRDALLGDDGGDHDEHDDPDGPDDREDRDDHEDHDDPDDPDDPDDHDDHDEHDDHDPGGTDRLDHALDRALAIGATSGADMVSGLLSGLSAWLPEPACAAAS